MPFRLPRLLFGLAILALPLAAQVVEPVVAAGRHTSLVLTDRGTVLGFGRNADGELGLGDRAGRNLPVPLAGLEGIVHLAAGDHHALYVGRDGRVRAAGRNHRGQLGDGTTTDATAHLEVPGLRDVARAAAGAAHSLFLTRAGEIWTVGANDRGQLGRGNGAAGNEETSADRVVEITDAFDAACGAESSYVLARDAAGARVLWAFGQNQYGQLGTGNTIDAPRPVRVPGVVDPVAVAAGDAHVVVLEASGRVLAFGRNQAGQLGLGDTVSRSSPTVVPGLGAVTDVACGSISSYLLENGGDWWAMGSNFFGELGVGDLSPGTNGTESSPRRAATPQSCARLDGGLIHAVGLGRAGHVVTFGSDALGQLGLGSGVAQEPTPRRLPTLRPGRPVAVVGPAEIESGTTADWHLGGFPKKPFAYYFFDLSGTGTQPGLALPGGPTVPLNPPLVHLDGGALLGPSRFTGFQGVLDAEGRARASFAVPPDPALAGLGLHAALLLFDSSGVPRLVSDPEPVLLTAPRPRLFSLHPADGAVGGGTRVTLRGLNLGGATAVRFDGVAGTGLRVVDPGLVRVDAPAHAPATVDVVVEDGLGATSTLAQSFTFRHTAPAAQVSHVLPNEGPVSGGLALVVHGSGFLPGATVAVGGTPASGVSVLGPDRIACTLPAGSLGAARVTVGNPNAPDHAVEDAFLYVPDLRLGTLSPGAPRAGESVTLEGEGFLSGLQLDVQGLPVPVTLRGLDRLEFTMPGGLGCDLTLTVTNPGGAAASRPLAETPTIASVLGSGAVGPGDALAVIGTGFDERLAATVNGTNVSVQRVSATYAVVTVPAGTPGSLANLVLRTGSGCTATASFRYRP